jgi:hypothetical protein
MPHLAPSIKLTIGPETISPVNLTPDVASHLASFGYNPLDFNWLRWTVGASRHSEGCLLVHGSDLTGDFKDQIRNNTAKLTLTSEVGDIEIEEMTIGAPTPLLCTNRGDAGGGFYKLPIYCARWAARTRPGTASYNIGETTADDPDGEGRLTTPPMTCSPPCSRTRTFR